MDAFYTNEKPDLKAGAAIVKHARSDRGGRVLPGLGAVLLLALGMRLAYVGHLSTDAVFSSVDAQGYRVLARNLLDHGVFSIRADPPLVADGIRTPLYPAFLAAVFLLGGNESHTVPIVQALLDTLTVAVVYRMVSALGSRRRALCAASLYALNPLSILYVGEALTETLLALLVALTFFVYAIALAQGRRREWPLAAVGVLASLCILCKPNLILLPLILVLGLLWDTRMRGRRIWLQAAVLAGAALLFVSPWLLRNRLALGEWSLSLAFDDNLAHVSAVATVLRVQHEEAAPWTPRWEQVYMQEVVTPAASRFKWSEEGGVPSADRDARHIRQMALVAKNIIREHRAAFVLSHARGVLRSLVPSLHRYWYGYFTGKPWPPVESLRSVLRGSAFQAAQGSWRAAVAGVRAWWGEHPASAQMLLVASVVSYLLGVGLLLAGMRGLPLRSGYLLSVGKTLAYLVLLPGPIAYIRFWVPGLPLAAALMGGGAERLLARLEATAGLSGAASRLRGAG